MGELKEEKGITSYFEYITLIFKIATESWQKAGGSGGSWKVTDDKGFRQAKIEPLMVHRISEKKDEDD